MQLEIIEILKNCKIKNEFENILERINTIDDLEKVWKNAHEHESDENYQINTPSINGKFIDKKKYIKDGFLTKDSKSADVLFVLKESHLDADEDIFWFQRVLNNEREDPRKYKEKLSIINCFLTKNDIKNAAYININKRGGCGRTDPNTLSNYAYYYRLLIKKQIELIKPKYIVCAGCFNIFVKNVILGYEKSSKIKWKKNLKNSYNYFESEFGSHLEYVDDKDNIFKIMDVYHPSAPGYNEEKYENRFKMYWEEIKDRI